MRAARRAFRSLRQLGWRVLLLILGVAIGLEVVMGVLNGDYTRGQYAFIILPLPVHAILVILLIKAFDALCGRLGAGRFLSFIVTLLAGFLTGMYIFIMMTRFDFPQLTSMTLAAIAVYEVFKLWFKGVYHTRPRRRRRRRSHP